MIKPAQKGWATSARPYHAIYSIEFSQKNILTGDSFKSLHRKPYFIAILDRLYKCILQEAIP